MNIENITDYVKKGIDRYKQANDDATTPDDYYYTLGQLNAFKEMLFFLEQNTPKSHQLGRIRRTNTNANV